jgi:hypothetical protein
LDLAVVLALQTAAPALTLAGILTFTGMLLPLRFLAFPPGFLALRRRYDTRGDAANGRRHDPGQLSSIDHSSLHSTHLSARPWLSTLTACDHPIGPQSVKSNGLLTLMLAKAAFPSTIRHTNVSRPHRWNIDHDA